MVTLLETPNSATAWCIDRSGKVYNVYVHPFGSLQDDSLEDAAWLWCNEFTDVKTQCARYYLATMWNDCDFASGDMSLEEFKEEIIESLEEIECLRGNANARKFGAWLGVLAEEQFKKTDWSDDWIYAFDLEELEDGIKGYLNNNILRVRFGSEFQTKIERAGSLYFRISSSGYNWYNNILKFIDDLSQRRKIVDITIEKDKESSGSDTVFVDHVSLNEFLTNKPVVAESLRRSYEKEIMNIMSDKQLRELMKEVIKETVKSASEGIGGPFGAAVIKDGRVICIATNRVLADKDPTAHAEVTAIREACKKLGTHDLSGCVLLATGEPCPMCLSAIIWANIDKVYYCNGSAAASEIGFRDDFIYDYIVDYSTGDHDSSVLDVMQVFVHEGAKLYADYLANKSEMY